MGVSLPSVLESLEFLRSQIAQNSGLLVGITDAALSFGIRQAVDGQTDWQTIYIERDSVRLESGAIPITYRAPHALIFISDLALTSISRGEFSEDISAEGDPKLLEQIAQCFNAPQTWLDLRSGR